jgi:hypothetical protein
MVKYNIHKDFAFLRFVPNTKRWMIPAFNTLFKWHFKFTKPPLNIEESSHQIKSFDNKEIEVLVFKPPKHSSQCTLFVLLSWWWILY